MGSLGTALDCKDRHHGEGLLNGACRFSGLGLRVQGKPRKAQRKASDRKDSKTTLLRICREGVALHQKANGANTMQPYQSYGPMSPQPQNTLLSLQALWPYEPCSGQIAVRSSIIGLPQQSPKPSTLQEGSRHLKFYIPNVLNSKLEALEIPRSHSL